MKGRRQASQGMMVGGVAEGKKKPTSTQKDPGWRRGGESQETGRLLTTKKEQKEKKSHTVLKSPSFRNAYPNPERICVRYAPFSVRNLASMKVEKGEQKCDQQNRQFTIGEKAVVSSKRQ
jgi:hypothetical protein